MERVEIVLERDEAHTQIDVWSVALDGLPELVWTTRRRYPVPADAIGWIARVAVLAALYDGSLYETPDVAWEEVEYRA
jgi:hypothetical protein